MRKLPHTEEGRPLFQGIACCLLVLAGTHICAQTIPDQTQELQRQDRQRQELRQRIEVQPWTPSTGLRQTPVYQRLPEEAPCVVIEHVEIQGKLLFAELHSALLGVQADDPPAGRCLGQQGITLLTQRVQEALVERGFITSQVHVPEQDLKSGVLTLHIWEGRIAQVRSEQEGEPLPKLAWAFESADVLNLRDVEQSLDNLHRLPSLRPRIEVEAGQKPGTSDVVVELGAQRPLRLGVAVDDGGNTTTGKIQGNATLSWDNPLGLSDMAYITKGQDLGGRDNGPRGSANQIVHYSVPMGYWLLGATLSDNSYHQTVYGPYESYIYSGTSSHKELSLQRVVHRDGQSKTTASVKGFLRQSNNYIADLEVLVQRRRTSGWEAGLQHLHYFEAGTLNAQMAYRRGTRAFDALPAPEEVTDQGAGDLQLMTGSIYWAMPFKLGKQALQYSHQFQWQWSQTRLTAQDRFCMGGRYTVRGFDGQQTLCGDRGQLWRQELSTALPNWPAMQAYAAIDAGRTTTPSQAGSYKLSGVALGLKGLFKWQDQYPLQFDFFVGKPLSRPDGFASSSQVTGVSIRADF
jgi:hemolysin activation/secretion protein